MAELTEHERREQTFQRWIQRRVEPLFARRLAAPDLKGRIGKAAELRRRRRAHPDATATPAPHRDPE